MDEIGTKQEPSLPKKTYSTFLWEVVFGVVQFMVNVQGGVFLTGYLLSLGSNNTQIGLISSIPVIVNIIAPFVSPLIERAESRKKISLRLILPTRILWILAAFIPLLVLYNGFAYPIILFVALFSVISIIGVAGGIAWTNWMGELIPEKGRGFYFGRRSIVAGIIGIVASLLLGYFLDKSTVKLAGFSAVYFLGAAAGLLSYLMLTRLPDTSNATPSKDGFSFNLVWKKIENVFANKNFMNLVWFNTAWAFALSFMGIWLNVYMLKELHMNYVLINAFGMVSTIANLVLTPFWSKVADKYGNKPVMLICANAVGFMPFLWAIIMPSNYVILIPLLYIIAGISWAGFNIGAFNIVLKLAPKTDRSFFLSINMLLPSITAAIAPIISGFLMDGIGARKIDLGFYTFGCFQLVFVLGGFMRSIPMRLLRKIQEPQEEHVKNVSRFIRTNIGSGFIEGLGVLLNYISLPITTSSTLVGKIIKRKDTDWYHCNLHILQIVSSGAFKVKEMNIISLSKQLREHGHNVIIAAKKDTQIYKKAVEAGFVVYDIDIRMWPNPFKIYKLYKIILQHKIHIIHSHSTTDLSNIIFASTFANNVPIVLSKYSYTPGSDTGLVNTWMYANVANVIASKDFLKKNLIESLPIIPTKAVTVYSGLDLKTQWVPEKYKNEARKSLGIKENEKIITLVARINESKDQLTLVEAAPHILRWKPNCKFLLVGAVQDEKDEAYKARLIVKMHEFNVFDKFIFTGFRNDIEVVVDASDIIVSCSVFETSGISLIQGMAMEKPVVGTKGGGSEIIVDGENGKVFTYADHEKLSNVIVSILNTKDEGKEMGKKGRKIAEEIFSLDKMTIQMENIYRHIRYVS